MGFKLRAGQVGYAKNQKGTFTRVVILSRFTEEALDGKFYSYVAADSVGRVAEIPTSSVITQKEFDELNKDSVESNTEPSVNGKAEPELVGV